MLPRDRVRSWLGVLAAWLVVLATHGACPGLAMPTMGQALWLTGFGESMVRTGPLHLYAHNFGLPLPAPIAFGLPGALPTGWLIAAGLHPADAYALVLWLWLALAFAGAVKLARLFGTPIVTSAWTAAVWLTLPLVWNHAHYSMLSMGFALLPAYVLPAWSLARTPQPDLRQRVGLSLLAVGTAVIAAFMDGYTFVFSSLAALAVLGGHALADRRLLRFAVPVQLASLGAAFFLYSRYVGRTDFHPDPLDTFRGWGVDLRFLLLPTQGAHALWDTLGLSEPRSTVEQFGDASVWQTTFVTPLLLAGLWAAWRLRRAGRGLAVVLVAVAAFGGYMALGPSLKFHHTRPVAMQGQREPSMPAELAGPSTGTARLSKNLPAFRNMRASYRWLGLTALGMWLLLVLWLAQPDGRRRSWLLAVLLIAQAPQLSDKWRAGIDYRTNIRALDDALLADLRADLNPQKPVVFLPYGNDFIINYLAARLDLHAYNVGGDKNLAMARAAWPTDLQSAEMNRIDADFVPRVHRLLESGVVHAIVLPHFDMLWAAHHWPCGEQGLAKCPDAIAQDLAPVERQLREEAHVQLKMRKFFTVLYNAP